ncbi:MAG TPA: diacylglycerol kinase family lipid kinase [Bacteroidales bacterium]|nr:diacylglycerol kinase family lipid kinase [Bacteroidales bacterium]HPT02459.1 diacylglycerol kinase family lipid kinase [Bacteroidales bacterium]
MDVEWFVIVNPNAGKRKGQHDWLSIAHLLEEAGIGYTNIFTEHRGHAMKLTRRYIENGFRKIIVVGGDGTLNEVVNGIFTQDHANPRDITLAMIPVGTGNDWCRMFGIPLNYKDAINLIVRGKVFLQDIGVVEYISSEGLQKKRHFANMAGMGFDALVAKKTNIQKEAGKGNPLSYFVNIFSSLFSFKVTRTQITLDDREIRSGVFSMSVGICQFNGGGMKQSPFAVPDDGLFDLIIISPIGKFKAIRNVLNLLDGSFTKLPEVSSFKSAFISIESDPPLYLEVDGESLGHSPFEFNIKKQSLHIITGK